MTYEPKDHDAVVRSRLRALQVDPEAGDFGAALHRRLVAAGAPRAPGLALRLGQWLRERPLLVGATAGAAVFAGALALLLIAPSLAPPMPSEETQATQLASGDPSTVETEPAVKAPQVPLDKVAVIRIRFTAEVAVENVDFVVELPAGVSFWNDGELLAERSFRWTGTLSAGANEIPVAVRATRPGTYRVRAVAWTEGQQMEHEVVFAVTEAG